MTPAPPSPYPLPLRFAGGEAKAQVAALEGRIGRLTPKLYR